MEDIGTNSMLTVVFMFSQDMTLVDLQLPIGLITTAMRSYAPFFKKCSI